LNQEAQELPCDIVAAPIVAWRVWRVIQPDNVTLTREDIQAMSTQVGLGENPLADLLGTRLAGVGASYVWRTATLNAVCQPPQAPMPYTLTAGSHGAPDRGCHCGVWGMKDKAAMLSVLNNYTTQPYVHAYGRVQMWGRVYEHSRGYRGQHARPLEITVINGHEDTCAELAAFYGCPVSAGPVPARAEAPGPGTGDRR
jgi:hypothetical protein